MSTTLRDLTRRATDAWGLPSQIRVTQEECAELIATINRYDRGRVSAESVAEEVADVYVTLEYARLLVGDAAVDAKIAEKLVRLKARLDAHEAKCVADSGGSPSRAYLTSDGDVMTVDVAVGVIESALEALPSRPPHDQEEADALLFLAESARKAVRP